MSVRPLLYTRRALGVALLVAATLVVGLRGAAAEQEDLVKRQFQVYSFSSGAGRGLTNVETAVGAVRLYTPVEGETFFDIARDFGLGYNELVLANPDADPWLPPTDWPIIVPTEWILPKGRYRGIVVNIPEMRLYYYPSPSRYGGGRRVVTFPVGLGRQDWQTPRAEFRVRGKTEDPTWVIPESIRKERLEDGLTETSIPGGVPENPLGKYRIELTLPSYAIHGTNKDFGIGMRISHGCVRLYPQDIETLYGLAEVGSAGLFVYQPVKLGVRDGRVLVEVHEDIYSVSPWLWRLATELVSEMGLTDYVDPDLLEAAVEAASGTPTDVGYVR